MARIPLYYTFGNHMHWVDMEWLWGYHVLPGSIRDMLRFCRETGARGNVNFEGIGYEKLAAEDPEALAELRQAVQEGIIEPVGCSYGQPYGLFHGGESNLRQRIYGARTARRLLGVWPKTFWEEEFDFFPQLPQMLNGCGFEYASLFFQWTWHTPEIPKEEAPVVWWEGQDGSRLLCATRNKLNLHQWPEDMDATFAELAASPPVAGEGPTPLILQWLELMPSPDWMCRSELLLPKMRELLSDGRFEIRMATLGEYLRSMGVPPMVSSDVRRDRDEAGHGSHGQAAHATGLDATLPVRRYTMDQVWHGMSLGKNADNMRRRSFDIESRLLAAESLAAALSFFGRPYAQWDVYPCWELEEGWRNLLMAQHHDNDECEGLCGHVGKDQYEMASRAAYGLMDRLEERVTQISDSDGDATWVYNPLGWARDWHVVHRQGHMTVVNVPPLGWTCVPAGAPDVDCGAWTVEGRVAKFRRGSVEVDVDLDQLTVTHLANSDFPHGLPLDGGPLWEWVGKDQNGNLLKLKARDSWWTSDREVPWVVGSRTLRIPVDFVGHEDTGYFTLEFICEPHHEGLDIHIDGQCVRPQPGLNDAFGWRMPIFTALPHIVSDEPYSVNPKNPEGEFLKKYPEGDWMTSPQWFETVHRPFTGNSFVDLGDESGSGLLISHPGARQWFAEDETLRHIIHAYDPWDEERVEGRLDNRFLLLPHKPKPSSELWRIAQGAHRNCSEEHLDVLADGIPDTFSALSCDSSNVVPTAFYRETEDYSGKHVENYAGKGMGYPFVVRLVEFDGIETEATLTVAGTVAAVYKTNHLGQILENLHPLTPSSISEKVSGQPTTSDREMEEGGPQTKLTVSLKPYEIATLYLDIVEGRKQTRDLDAKRKIWATVHRVDD
jgi:alpha-mannosidase